MNPLVKKYKTVKWWLIVKFYLFCRALGNNYGKRLFEAVIMDPNAYYPDLYPYVMG